MRAQPKFANRPTSSLCPSIPLSLVPLLPVLMCSKSHSRKNHAFCVRNRHKTDNIAVFCFFDFEGDPISRTASI
jgi:hypothetical protein